MKPVLVTTDNEEGEERNICQRPTPFQALNSQHLVLPPQQPLGEVGLVIIPILQMKRLTLR